MMKFARFLAALSLCLISMAARADYTMMNWGLDRANNPYKIGINLNGTWYQFATITSGGTVSLLPASASALGGVFSKTCSSSQWFSALATTGTFTCTQPGAADVTFTQNGTGAIAQTVDSAIKLRRINIGDYHQQSDPDYTLATQRAINYLCSLSPTGGTAEYPQGSFTVAAVTANCDGVFLEGQGPGGTTIVPASTSTTVFTFGDGATPRYNLGLSKLKIASASQQASGTYVRSWLTNNFYMSDFVLEGPFQGIVFDGTSVIQYVDHGKIVNTTPGGSSIVVNGGNDHFLSHIVTDNPALSQPSACIFIARSDATWVDSVDCIHSGNGLVVSPSGSNAVTWLFISNSAFDTGTGIGINISPQGNGVVRGVNVIDSWTATNDSHGVAISKAAGATVDGVFFYSHRSYNNGLDGVLIDAGDNVYFDGAQITANSRSSLGTYSGFHVAAGVSQWGVKNSRIGTFAGFADSQAYSIRVDAGSSNYYQVENNSLLGYLTAAFYNAATGSTFTISGNLPLSVNVSTACTSVFQYMTDAQIADVRGRTLLLDVTTPLQQFLNAIATGGNYCLEAGWYKFTSTLTVPPGARQFLLTGHGSHETQLVYSGASTNVDLFQLGDFTVSNTDHNTLGVTLGGFTVRPDDATTMTAGVAFHLGQLDQSYVYDINVGGGTLYFTRAWDGVYFDGAHQVTLDRSKITALNDGVVVRGINSSSNADLSVNNSWLNQSGNAGLHSTGGFGGLFVNGTEILGNLVNGIRIDKTAQTAHSTGTREVILNGTTVIDGAGYATAGDCVVLDDDDANLGTFMTSAYIGSCGGDGIRVGNWPDGLVNVTAGRVFNNTGNGIHIVDTTTKVVAGSNVTIDTNTGFGVTADSRTNNTHLSAVYYGNTAGNVSANAITIALDGVLATDFVGVDPTGATDSRAGIIDAIATGKMVKFPVGSYKLSDMVTIQNGQRIECDGGPTQSYFYIDAASFNMAAQGVVKLPSGSDRSSIVGCGFLFAQVDTAVRANVRQYPPAIFAQDATRFYLDQIRVSGGWKCLDASGNTGGAVIGMFECGGLSDTNTTLFDGALDFTHIDNYHCWPFGMPTTTLNSVYKDMTTNCATFGRVDGLDIKDLASFNGSVIFTSNANLTSISSHIGKLSLDDNGAYFRSAGGYLSIDFAYSTKSAALASEALLVTSGIVDIANYHGIVDGQLLCSVRATSGGALRINGGNVKHDDTASSAMCVDGANSTLLVSNLTAAVNPVNRTAGFFSQTGATAYMKLSNISIAGNGGATGSVITFATDNGGNLLVGSPLNGWAITYPAGVTSGFYQVGGVTVTSTVRDSAGTGTCTMIFIGGLRTGGTC